MGLMKLLGSEAICNDTPNTYSSRVVRLINKGAAVSTVTLKEQPQAVNVAISNTAANSTTLLVLGSGTTANLKPGVTFVNSSNLAVINTQVSSKLATVINSTAITSNVDIIVANGTCVMYAVDSIKAISILPNAELLIEKSVVDFIESNNAANVMITPVSYKG
jgi:hypothetical protein